MAYINIDVDLDEFEARDLINEFKERWKGKKWGKLNFSDEQKKEIRVVIIGKATQPLVGNLADQLKMEHFASVIDKYSIEDIQHLLP